MFGCSNYCVHRELCSIGLHDTGLFDQQVAVFTLKIIGHVYRACVFSASDHTNQAVITNKYHTAPPSGSSRTAPLPSHFDGLSIEDAKCLKISLFVAICSDLRATRELLPKRQRQGAK